MKRTVFFMIFSLMAHLGANQAFDEFADLYARHGHLQYTPMGEVTQLGHVLEAAYMAERVGAPEEVVVALLFHDVARLAIVDEGEEAEGEAAHRLHDEDGALWVEKRGFPAFVGDFIRNHTMAKLLLCMEDFSYHGILSPASTDSYVVQKAKYLGTPRFEAFCKDPKKEDYKAVRLFDEMAKIQFLDPILTPDSALPRLESYREVVTRVLAGEGRAARHENWRERARAWHHLRFTDPEAFDRVVQVQ
jgi:predicted HD phosphohydrolase